MTDQVSELSSALRDRYEIERVIGVGGMATVYLARDVKHRRAVAIKVLSPELAASVGSDRFLREIEVTAGLAHPHILPLHDSGKADDVLFYVMPHVDGESLRDRLSREGRLALPVALGIARQVADALGYAHRKGVVHRDIKPENILLQGDSAMVADFGIARALSAARDSRITGTGLVVGTAAYMSPEQAAGQADLDGRSDIYGLACVLFEMLTGSPPFTGSSAAAVIGKRFTDPAPRLGALAPDVPRALDDALAKALAREPSERFASAHELAAALGSIAGGNGLQSRSRRTRAMTAAGLLAIAILMAGAWRLVATRIGAPASPRQLTHFVTPVRDPVISPKGDMLAFVAQEPQSFTTQIYVKPLPDGRPVQLTRTPGKKAWPAFSPDGSRIAYTVVGTEWNWDTWETSVIGGTPKLMLRRANSLQWLPDGRVVFSEFRQGTQLAVVIADESGARRREVFVPALNEMLHFSDVSPDGQRVAIGRMRMGGVGPSGEPGGLDCLVMSLRDSTVAPRRVGGSEPCSMFVRWSHDGKWLYFASGRGATFQVWREPARGGRPERITSGTGLAVMGALASFALARDGRSLIFPSGEAQESLWLRGEDGRERQLTFEGNARSPVVSTDGRSVYYIAGPRYADGEVWVRSLDGADDARQLCPGVTATTVAVSHDGRHLALSSGPEVGVRQIWLCSTDRSYPPRKLTASDAAQRQPVFSPDGSTIYYVEARGVQSRLWAIDRDGTNARPISPEGAPISLTAVSPDGAWLSVTRTGQTPRESWLYPSDGAGEPRRLFRSWNFEWTPNGKAFLLVSTGMISSAWEIPNVSGSLIPAALGEEPTEAAIEKAGGRNVLTADFFAYPRAMPTLYRVVYSKVENRSNLFEVPIPR